MSDECTHTDAIRDVTPSALGCEECLKIGSEWLHLRLCRICGHVGCCDDSPNRHATKHFHATRHPIIEGYDPAGRLGVVLCGRGDARSQQSRHTAQWSDPALLLTRRLVPMVPGFAPARHNF
jgi:Zn-finger in ubiquitin-hydrolases and other protein